MTKSEIVTKTKLYLDDMSELSDAEFGDLFDKMYRRVNGSRTWEGLKREYTGTTSASVPHVSLPTGFLSLTENYNHTDSSYSAERPVIFYGTEHRPVEVVSWSDRRQYRESSSHAYIDLPNNRLVFCKQPDSSVPIEFDYYVQATVLGDNDSPWFPAEYHDVLYHMMCADDFIIQQSEKARSYQREHEQKAKSIMEDLEWWNSQLVQL